MKVTATVVSVQDLKKVSTAKGLRQVKAFTVRMEDDQDQSYLYCEAWDEVADKAHVLAEPCTTVHLTLHLDVQSRTYQGMQIVSNRPARVVDVERL